jgi:NAD(P)-dependent dehydrogenase (short-subunit alcohol dehydrogenase family)
MGKLDGKVALVTGSGRDIGRTTVLKLVVVSARSNRAEADDVAREARRRAAWMSSPICGEAVHTTSEAKGSLGDGTPQLFRKPARGSIYTVK